MSTYKTRPHYLAFNKSSTLPQSWIIVDTEANIEYRERDVQHHTLSFGWGAYLQRTGLGYAETWERFTTANEFWTWALGFSRSKTTLFIVAHNWQYDAALLDLGDSLLSRGWICNSYICEPGKVLIRLSLGSKRVCILDSLNWFGTSLEKLGESIGIQKLPMPGEGEGADAWDTYCRKDVKVLIEAIKLYIYFISSQELGKWQPTLASQALGAFRHKFMDHPILVHKNIQALAMEREAYHGARTECFRIGSFTGQFYNLDVNSMYPAVMAKELYPSRLLCTFADFTLEMARMLLDSETARHSYGMIAQCELDTDEAVYAVKHDPFTADREEEERLNYESQVRIDVYTHPEWIEKPPWAVGKTTQEIHSLAKSLGRTAYEPDWWESLGKDTIADFRSGLYKIPVETPTARVRRARLEKSHIYSKLRGKRLIFPVGSFQATLTTNEIRYAIAHDHLKSIKSIAIYQMEPLFTRFMQGMYQARITFEQSGNAAFAYLCKILLNAFYGKFGQRAGTWEERGQATEDDVDDVHIDIKGKVHYYRVRLGLLQEKMDLGEAFNSLPSIAAHITANARLYLWELIKKAGPSNTFYCDTDSVVVNANGFDNLREWIRPGELGSLKLEKSFTSLQLYGPKDYVMGDDRRIKGVSRKAVANGLSPDGHPRFVQPYFEKWAALETQGIKGKIIVRPLTKTLQRMYTKGEVNPDGTVSPFTL